MSDHFPTFRRILSRTPVLGDLLSLRTTPAQQRSVMRLIAAASEVRLPLGPLLEVWARDERGLQRERVRRLAELLHQGIPLPDAVEQVPAVMGEENVLGLRFASQMGTFGPSLRKAVRDSELAQGAAQRIHATAGYFFKLVPIALVITAFFVIKIVPALQSIFVDFGLKLPGPTLWSIQFARLFESLWWLAIPLLLLLGWSSFSATPARFLVDRVFAPLFAPLRRMRHAEVLENLAVASAAGRPMSGALSTLARYHFNPTTRRKLLYVRNEVEQGVGVWQGLADAGVLTLPERDVLDAADRVGNRPWALQLLAGRKRRTTHRLLNRLADLALPVGVFCFGAFVLLQGLALMVPLITMVGGLRE